MKKALIIGGEVPLERYRSVMEEFPLATVDVVLLNPDRTKTLLGKRTRDPYVGQFCTFGGRLYKNEEFKDAAIRIAKEETGIALSPAELTFAGVINEINDNSVFPGVGYHAVDIYFVCVIKEQAVVLEEQHSEAQWLSVEDQTFHPNVRTRIEGALRAL